jgi:NAD(P)-dependent dehydrogenase (short-subunit alcohol dehydrogenase family)
MAAYSPRRGQPDFDPSVDIPDLGCRVCLVVGGTSGLGEATATALAQHSPKKLYLTARSRARADAAVGRIRATSKAAQAANITILDIDLSSLESVREATARLNREADRLDLVHLSGGVGLLPHATSTDGYEIQFATNYLGHALLTQLLMPKLLQTAALPGADVRIISMSSRSHKTWSPPEGILFDELKSPMTSRTVFALYGQSTLAKALFAHELSKRYPQITSVSLHPRGVKTNVFEGEKGVNWLLYHLIMKPVVYMTGVSPEEGAKTQLWCSVSPDVKSGEYYEPVGMLGGDGRLTKDDELSSKLWTWTDKELRVFGSPGWVQRLAVTSWHLSRTIAKEEY